MAPGGLEFASQPLTTVSAPQEVSVTNVGARALQVIGESFTGPNADDFLISASTCRGRVPGGETCTLWVRFAPASKGEEKRDATLVLDTNATPATYEVDLAGVAGKLPSGDPGQPGQPRPAGPDGSDRYSAGVARSDRSAVSQARPVRPERPAPRPGGAEGRSRRRPYAAPRSPAGRPRSAAGRCA